GGMKRFISIVAVLIAATPIAGRVASAQTNEQKVAEAVKPLPDDLKAGATVVTYDAKTGARQVLRQGTNFIECQPTMADGFIRCYNKTLAPRRDLEAKLKAEKKSEKEISDAVAAAGKSGAIPPAAPGMMSYRGYDKRDRIKNL